jgi:glycosyltransferase involved in cell wall biosynthesis
MRVLLVLGTTTGGVGRHVHGLVSGLARRGHSVLVACPAGVEEQFALAAAGARHVPLAVSDRPRPLADLRAISTLGELLRRADVVHAHGLRAGALACLAALGSEVPVVVTLHNAAPSGAVTAGCMPRWSGSWPAGPPWCSGSRRTSSTGWRRSGRAVVRSP